MILNNAANKLAITFRALRAWIFLGSNICFPTVLVRRNTHAHQTITPTECGLAVKAVRAGKIAQFAVLCVSRSFHGHISGRRVGSFVVSPDTHNTYDTVRNNYYKILIVNNCYSSLLMLLLPPPPLLLLLRITTY